MRVNCCGCSVTSPTCQSIKWAAADLNSGSTAGRAECAFGLLVTARPMALTSSGGPAARDRRTLDAWRKRSLTDLDVVYLYLDGFALRVRSAGKVVSVPVLGVAVVLADGHTHLLALERCGGESFAAWKGCFDDLVARGLRAPLLCITDGNAGLRHAVGEAWRQTAVQRCAVHKLRNLERKAPKHALAEIRDEFHSIVYATSADAARIAYAGFERT